MLRDEGTRALCAGNSSRYPEYTAAARLVLPAPPIRRSYMALIIAQPGQPLPGQREPGRNHGLPRDVIRARNQNLSAVLARKRPQPRQIRAAVPVNVIDLLHQNQTCGHGLLPQG